MRRGREEQAVLESMRYSADRASEFRFDPEPPSSRRRGMVRFVEYQQASGQEIAQPFAHGIGVVRIDQEIMGDQEPTMRPPWIHPEAPLSANPREIESIEDNEDETEAFLEFRLPLFEH